MNGRLARTAASAALLVVLLLNSAPVLASCVMPPPVEDAVEDAEMAFVGTVASVANSGRWAMVAVEEVWKGPDLAPVVELRGGPEGDAATSVDRSFTAGTRYLFLPFISEGALQDTACSSTTEFTPDLARLRPATARPPVSARPDPDAAVPFDPVSLIVPATLVIGAGAMVFGAALLLRRRT